MENYQSHFALAFLYWLLCEQMMTFIDFFGFNIGFYDSKSVCVEKN